LREFTTKNEQEKAESNQSTKRTHYAVLGVAPGSSHEQIRAKYLILAIAHHPDKVGVVGLERFQEITESYAVLKDSTTRHKYDLMLKMLGHQCLICEGRGLVSRTISFGLASTRICGVCGGTGQA